MVGIASLVCNAVVRISIIWPFPSTLYFDTELSMVTLISSESVVITNVTITIDFEWVV